MNKIGFTKIIAMCLAVLLLCSMCSVNVEAAVKYKAFSIKENGRKVRYSGQVLKVKYNNKNVKITKVPGLMQNGYAMLPYKEVFQDKAGIKCTYQKSKKKLTMEYGSKTLVMTVGKKNAYLNGKKKKLPVAPRYIKYVSSKKNRVIVPSRKVSELLGFEYTWNASNGTISIQEIDPNALSITYNKTTYSYSGIQYTFTVDGQALTTTMPGLTLNGYNYIPGKEVLQGAGCTYSRKKSKITITGMNHTVTMKVGSKSATLDGSTKKMKAAPLKVTNNATGVTYVMLPIKYVASYLGITYSSDDTAKVMTLSTGKEQPVLGGATVAILKPTGIAMGMAKGDDNISLVTQGTDVVITNDYKMTIGGGDYQGFYQQNPIDMGQSGVTVTPSFDGANTVLTFHTTVNWGMALTEDASYYYLKVGKPNEVFSKVVVIDPGHGGSDGGASGNGLVEKNVVLEITRDNLKPLFDADPSCKVYYTRLTDCLPSLAERYTMANNMGADIFISIHCNSAENAAATGTETIYGTANQTAVSGMNSQYLATLADANLVAALGLTDRKAYADVRGLAVLRGTKMPATLAELAFLSNVNDAAALSDPAKRQGIAQAIYNTVIAGFTTYPTGR